MTEPIDSTAAEFASWLPALKRRAAVRVASDVRASYRVLEPDGDVGQALVRNLSTLGVGLVLVKSAVPSMLLRIDFESATRGKLCSRLGRVIHAEVRGEGEVGRAFVREMADVILRLFDAQRLPTTGGDDRRWVRFPCNVETACNALHTAPVEESPARIINISAGGMGLMLPCEFGTGTLLKLDMEGTPASAAGPVLLRVVRATAQYNSDWFHGCEFADPLTDKEFQALL
jgi:hypothetical protein